MNKGVLVEMLWWYFRQQSQYYSSEHSLLTSVFYVSDIGLNRFEDNKSSDVVSFSIVKTKHIFNEQLF